jgi:glyoxylase-like metal-dependent hydrolase (beta-lactamase superfamily II)
MKLRRMIPLEDQFNDIIGKALRGLKLSDAEVAKRAGCLPGDVQKLRDGSWNAAIARKLAPELGLGAEALVAIGEQRYRPAPLTVDGLEQFNTPFEDMTVNSYLIWDDASRVAVAFDTGADCSGMLDVLADKALRLAAILLTHTHGDHVLELDRLREKTAAPAYVSELEPISGAEPFPAGRPFAFGRFEIATHLTWGHSKGGISYLVRGLARPVAVVGDAIFAGSMGGGGVSYTDALATNRSELLPLPDETVICPGHGPLTTIGEEKRHNPFFAP